VGARRERRRRSPEGSPVYLEGTVDAASQVMESNEDNNDATSVEYQSCIPK